jgi:hypothetical protein
MLCSGKAFSALIINVRLWNLMTGCTKKGLDGNSTRFSIYLDGSKKMILLQPSDEINVIRPFNKHTNSLTLTLLI